MPLEQILTFEGSSDANNTTKNLSLEDSSNANNTTLNQEESRIEKDDSSALQKKLWDLYHPAAIQNVESIANNVSASNVTGCIACINKHFPDGCSISIEDEEGHGEKRICTLCSNDSTKSRSSKRPRPVPVDDSVPVDNFSAELVKSLNNKEKWNKRKKSKQSSYLHPVPNWDLVFDVDKKVKIGLLSNGNISKTIYNVNGEAVALRNTCAFDSIVQV